jgi:hypothetical protein
MGISMTELFVGVSAEKFEMWMTPLQAVHLLASVFGTDSKSYAAKHTLMERLRGEMVRAVARTTTRSDVPGKCREFADIPSSDWTYIDENNLFWQTGDLTYRLHRGALSVATEYRQFDVRFEPLSVQAIIASSSKATVKGEVGDLATPAPPKRVGGRPPKSWWEDFWIEMCRATFEGRIRPEMTQAAIQDVMHQWVSDQNYEAGPTVIKEAAKKLSKALKT